MKKQISKVGSAINLKAQPTASVSNSKSTTASDTRDLNGNTKEGSNEQN